MLGAAIVLGALGGVIASTRLAPLSVVILLAVLTLAGLWYLFGLDRTAAVALAFVVILSPMRVRDQWVITWVPDTPLTMVWGNATLLDLLLLVVAIVFIIKRSAGTATVASSSETLRYVFALTIASTVSLLWLVVRMGDESLLRFGLTEYLYLLRALLICLTVQSLSAEGRNWLVSTAMVAAGVVGVIAPFMLHSQAQETMEFRSGSLGFSSFQALAAFLCMTIPGTVLRVIDSSASARSGVMFGLVLIGQLAGLYATSTRSAWIATAIVVIYISMKYRKLTPLIVFGSAVSIYLLTMYESNIIRFQNIFDASSNSLRTWVYSATLRLIADNFLVGIGPGDLVFPVLAIPYHPFVHAHNLLLDQLAKLGILGLAIWGHLLWTILRRGLTAIGHGGNWVHRAVFLGLSAFLVQQLFEYTLWEFKVWWVFWVWVNVLLFKTSGKGDRSCVSHS